jgi:hypothetical protein
MCAGFVLSGGVSSRSLFNFNNHPDPKFSLTEREMAPSTSTMIPREWESLFGFHNTKPLSPPPTFRSELVTSRGTPPLLPSILFLTKARLRRSLPIHSSLCEYSQEIERSNFKREYPGCRDTYLFTLKETNDLEE